MMREHFTHLDAPAAPGQEKVLILASCGCWRIEYRPPGVKYTSPRVCSSCAPSAPGAVGRSPQGMALTEVRYLTEWTERALDD